MDVLGYRITFNKIKKPKINRSLELELFHTFKDGTRISTYKDEDLASMSSRHYEALKQDVRMVKEYGMTKERRDMYFESIKDTAKKGVNGEIKKGESIAKVLELINDFERQRTTEIDINDSMWLNIYCMFFVLDDENELTYSKSANARKIKLLETCTEEEKELFFSLVQIRLDYYKNTLVQDTIDYLVETQANINQGNLLKSLTEQLALNSTLQDSQT